MKTILQHLSFSDKMNNALHGLDEWFSKMLKILIGLEKGVWDSPVFDTIRGTKFEQRLPRLCADAISMANAFYE